MHALLGENGAGKSTLVKIVAGALAPDAGDVAGRREPCGSRTADAVEHGIAVVSQELNVFPDLDVLANLFPMREITRGPFVDSAARWPRGRGRCSPTSASTWRCGRSVGELAWPSASCSRSPRRCSPTARADPRRADLGAGRASTGCCSTRCACCATATSASCSSSHILEDVMALCDEVTVLRDGEVAMAARPRAS